MMIGWNVRGIFRRAARPLSSQNLRLCARRSADLVNESTSIARREHTYVERLIGQAKRMFRVR